MLDWLACTCVKLIGGLLCRLPPSVAVWLGEQLGALAYWLQPKRTRMGVRNLRAAFEGTLTPAQARRIIHACCRQLGAGVVELLRLPVMDRASIERYVRIEGLALLEEAVRSGQAVILLTGHYGNWELGPIVSALLGYPIMVLARAQDKLPKLYRLLVSYRESKGCTVVHKGGAMKRLVAALDQRRLVGIVGDQASRHGLFSDFFGRPALFTIGPFALAYRTGALILPAFIRRVRGPFHHIRVEPPFRLSPELPEAEAIRQGITYFTGVLSRQIREDPSQWLWMHNRWKYTPARRIVILSDGKRGHVKQSLVVLEALRERWPLLTHRVVEPTYRRGWGRLLAVCWSWWMPARLGADRCLAWALSSASAQELLRCSADVVISCGSAVTALNALVAALTQAKSIAIMNPAPVPLGRFHVVIAPRHDRLPPRSNVVPVIGAVSRIRDEDLRQARERLSAHPRFRQEASGAQGAPLPPAGRGSASAPVIAVLIGGDSPSYELTPAFAEALVEQVAASCDVAQGFCVVTTSRRTSPAVGAWLSERLADDPRCRLLLMASRDPLDGTMEGMLGCADVAVVTGESISMVSEACASGRPVLVIEPPRRRAARGTLTKHHRFLQDLVRQGCARLVTVSELGPAIQRTLADHRAGARPAGRVDNYATIRDALARLI